MNDEELARVRERVASIESTLMALDEKIKAGDDNVRQGIEAVKSSVVAVKSDISEIKRIIISEEGKQNINMSLADLKLSVASLDEKFDNHLVIHAEETGYSGAIDNFKNNWIIPVATALLIAGLLALFRLLGTLV